METHLQFMETALNEAAKAFETNEVPIGAVVVFDNKLIGRGFNQVETLGDATAHAEIIALSAAYNYFGDWRLENCTLYSTVEPCSMCAGAAVLSRLDTIVFGARDPKFGACGSIFEIPTDKRLNHNVVVVGGVMEKEASALMKSFFQKVRQGKERVN